MGIDVEPEERLYAEALPTELRYGNGELRAVPPASFHHVSPEDMRKLDAAHEVYSSDGKWRADFAMFALAKFSHHEASRTFRLRFGHEVVVSDNSTGGSPWRAGGLVNFRAAQPGRSHSFEQEYRGGACRGEAGLTAPSKAITAFVHLLCDGCGDVSRKVSEKVCRARMLDACSIELLVSLPCPAWKRVG